MLKRVFFTPTHAAAAAKTDPKKRR